MSLKNGFADELGNNALSSEHTTVQALNALSSTVNVSELEIDIALRSRSLMLAIDSVTYGIGSLLTLEFLSTTNLSTEPYFDSTSSLMSSARSRSQAPPAAASLYHESMLITYSKYTNGGTYASVNMFDN
jgi:hypothetical protein